MSSSSKRCARAAAHVVRIVIVVLMGHAAPSVACPDCHVGRVARRQVADGFAGNLLIALAPFAFVLAATALAERTGKPR